MTLIYRCPTCCRTWDEPPEGDLECYGGSSGSARHPGADLEILGATRDDVLRRLRHLAEHGDMMDGHVEADELLLALADDAELAAAYRAVGKWYA